METAFSHSRALGLVASHQAIKPSTDRELPCRSNFFGPPLQPSIDLPHAPRDRLRSEAPRAVQLWVCRRDLRLGESENPPIEQLPRAAEDGREARTKKACRGSAKLRHLRTSTRGRSEPVLCAPPNRAIHVDHARPARADASGGPRPCATSCSVRVRPGPPDRRSEPNGLGFVVRFRGGDPPVGAQARDRRRGH
jgi:hypothetical protein